MITVSNLQSPSALLGTPGTERITSGPRSNKIDFALDDRRFFGPWLGNFFRTERSLHELSIVKHSDTDNDRDETLGFIQRLSGCEGQGRCTVHICSILQKTTIGPSIGFAFPSQTDSRTLSSLTPQASLRGGGHWLLQHHFSFRLMHDRLKRLV